MTAAICIRRPSHDVQCLLDGLAIGRRDPLEIFVSHVVAHYLVSVHAPARQTHLADSHLCRERSASGCGAVLRVELLDFAAAPATHQLGNGDHDDRADHGHDHALDVEAGDVRNVQEGAPDEPADHCPDDAEDDHHDESLTGAHDQVGDETGDGPEDDPRENAHSAIPPIGATGVASRDASPLMP